MFKKSIYLAAYCLLFSLVMGLSHAEQKAGADDKTELTNFHLILTGNTVEGKTVSSQTSYKMYFHPSGKLARHDSKANKANVEKGSWRISNTTDLCITFAAEKCFTVKKRGDGEFDLYAPNEELIFTIDKVILGNPNKYDALT
ncbi:MAG: hypothetical protein KAI17_11985 [Thiotrichaceae bacterium]|nr:hypothetical protein [Thiotrichaceae bacterium]